MRNTFRSRAILFLIAAAGCLLVGCLPSYLPVPEGEATGTLSLVLVIPDYAAAKGEGSQGKIIDPQTSTVGILLDGQFVQEVRLVDMTATQPVHFYTARSSNLQVPARTYHSVGLNLRDAAGVLLASGETTGEFVVTQTGSVSVTVFCAPASSRSLESLDTAYGGHVGEGAMEYYSFVILYDTGYQVQFTGSVRIFVLSREGQIIADSLSSPVALFVAPPEGSDSKLDGFYIGVYGVVDSDYTVTLVKTTSPPVSDHLLINEVSLGGEWPSAFELYNPTLSPVNVSGYRLRIDRKWGDSTWFLGDVQELTLPATSPLPAGGYLAVFGNWNYFSSEKLNSVQQAYVIAEVESWTSTDAAGQYRQYAMATPNGPYSYNTVNYSWASTRSARPDMHVLPGSNLIVLCSEREWSSALSDYIAVQQIKVTDTSSGTYWWLTSDTDSSRDPRWAPDGTRVGYASDKHAGSGFDIYTQADANLSAAARTEARITTDPADELWPSWSPDGTMVAFASNRSGHYEIFVVNADGTGETKLTTNIAGDDLMPAWSPDGSRILFVSGNSANPYDCDLATLSASTYERTVLTTTRSDYSYPEWIDDGTIAYTASEYQQSYGYRVYSVYSAKLSNWAKSVIFTRSGNGPSGSFYGCFKYLATNPPVGFAADKVNYVSTGSDWSWGQGQVMGFSLISLDGSAIDFVQIGGRSIWPPQGTGWDPSAGIIQPQSSTIARAISDGAVFDSDSALDWSSSYGTLGFANDTQGNQDTWVHAQ